MRENKYEVPRGKTSGMHDLAFGARILRTTDPDEGFVERDTGMDKCDCGEVCRLASRFGRMSRELQRTTGEVKSLS